MGCEHRGMNHVEGAKEVLRGQHASFECESVEIHLELVVART